MRPIVVNRAIGFIPWFSKSTPLQCDGNLAARLSLALAFQTGQHDS